MRGALHSAHFSLSGVVVFSVTWFSLTITKELNTVSPHPCYSAGFCQ